MNKYICNKPTSWIRGDTKNLDYIGKNDSQIIYGEAFTGEQEEVAFISGQSDLDGYKGAVRVDNLSMDVQPRTHRVDVPLSHIYREPSFKIRPLMSLPMMAEIRVTNEVENGFQKICDMNDSWIFTNHICPNNQYELDYIKTAQMFLHAPYLYGGQSILGIDCSGLTRISLMRAGISCPRDCDRQVKQLNNNIDNLENFERGDIVYFKGHVVIMLGDKLCINATARHMKTIIEDISDVCHIYGSPVANKNYLNRSPII